MVRRNARSGWNKNNADDDGDNQNDDNNGEAKTTIIKTITCMSKEREARAVRNHGLGSIFGRL